MHASHIRMKIGCGVTNPFGEISRTRAALKRAHLTPMAPVSSAERAALEAFFRGKRGARKLIEHSAVSLTRAYFADKGTTLPELPTARPPDAARLADWQEEWLDTAVAAGTADKLDQKNIVRWVTEDAGAATAMGSRLGKAAAVADALARKGIAIDRDAEMAITAALAASDAGDMVSQCRDFGVIWLIYTGQSPGEEERRLFQEKRMACSSEADPLVDVRLFKAYGKQHSTTTVPTLERALRDASGRMWADYYSHVLRLLTRMVFCMQANVGSNLSRTPRSWPATDIYQAPRPYVSL